jgi:hypothetical protein
MVKAILGCFVLAVLLHPPPAFAQNNPTGTAVAPGCGAPDAKFDVKTGKEQHPTARPDHAKALVYFIEDDSDFDSTPKPTTRMGLDGRWVGATHGNSYFYISVDPGEHHLCASWQSTVILRQGHQTVAAHFTADPGGVYYFRVRNAWWLDHGSARIDLEPLDSDEGQVLASKFSLSTFHLKK